MFTTIDDAIGWQQVHQVRADLADYLAGLSDAQWNHDSLCAGWRVRDVVAHLLLEYHYRGKTSWQDFVKSGFRTNTFLKRTASLLGQQPPAELLAQFHAIVAEELKPDSVSVLNVLIDLLIHEQDIRIPLAQSRDMPLAAVTLVLTHWQPTDFNFGEKLVGLAKRTKGLMFTATDVGLTKGSGLAVSGKAQDIMLAITGRTVALERLHGEGVAVLRQRLLLKG